MTELHVVFQVGQTEYVLPAQSVHQMAAYEGATPVPGALDYVAGLMQVRGQLLPVVDLRRRFGLPADANAGAECRVIIVKHGTRLVGLLADKAREVLHLDESQFELPPDLVRQQAGGFVAAVARHGSRLLLRIDSEKVIGKDSFDGNAN